MKSLKIFWQRWKIIAHKIGDFQARLILSLFYFVIVGPFAIGLRLFSDPLRLKAGGGWLDCIQPDGDAATLARHQH